MEIIQWVPAVMHGERERVSDAACTERVMSGMRGHRRYVIAAVRALGTWDL